MKEQYNPYISPNEGLYESFDRLMAEREDDVIRVVERRAKDRQRKQKSESLLRWYMKNTETGQDSALSEEELQSLKSTWEDIWELGVVRPEWAQIYKNKTGAFDPNYIGSDLHYYYVEWSKIDYDYLRGFLDKNYMDILLPAVKHPPTLIRKVHWMYLDEYFNKIELETAIDIIYRNRFDGVVLKISAKSSGGKGVSFVDGTSTKEIYVAF